MHLGYIELEKVCISLIWNLNALQCAQFRAISSNAIISKRKGFLSIFYYISEMCMQEHFEKKDEYPSLIISKIMDCERGGYLNV